MNANSQSRVRSVAMVGLSIALIAVSAWIVIPIGPIPFTLQMFSIPLVMFVLKPKDAVAAVLCYLLIGAVGVPVFSGMRGGFGVILGPTGGFLLGYIPGTILGCLVLYFYRKRRPASAVNAASTSNAENSTVARRESPAIDIFMSVLAGLLFVVVAYIVGCIQFMAVSSVGIEAALVACVVPFVIPDIVKVLAAALIARPINTALRFNQTR